MPKPIYLAKIFSCIFLKLVNQTSHEGGFKSSEIS